MERKLAITEQKRLDTEVSTESYRDTLQQQSAQQIAEYKVSSVCGAYD